MEDQLFCIMSDRGIPDETIELFKKEHIDCSTILLMDDEKLKEYIPKLGDRLQIIDFCKRKNLPKKYSLIERLQQKINNKRTGSTEGDSSSAPDKKRICRKETRTIEVGWFCGPKDKLSQVRSKNGGGTRKISVSRSTTMKELESIAIKLFFPNNESVNGKVTEFHHSILDFKQYEIENTLTVETILEETKSSKLRFYLASTRLSVPPNTEKTTQESPEEENNPLNVEDPIPSASTIYNSSEHKDATSYYEHFYLEDNEELLTADTNLDFFESTVFSLEPAVEEPAVVDVRTPPKTIILHRGKVFEELIEAVKMHHINDFQCVTIEMILPNGIPEKAEDIGGVLRDALTEFWASFYDQCTVGTSLKVPFLRHDFQEDEWNAIAKILLLGYKAEKYFPVNIAPVFIQSCIGEAIHDEEIIENFLKYISESETLVVTNALKDFNSAEFEDIIEFCSNYKSRLTPTQHNFRHIIKQIGHEELIQKPAFVEQCFSSLKQLKSSDFKLSSIYEKLNPSAKNIIALLDVDQTVLQMTENRNTYQYLTKFIKESNEEIRRAFLRFCTGSDLSLKAIKVEFNSKDGLKRIPVSHTCTGLLELPNCYENYVVFRSEFKNLLSSNIWVMDIV